MHPRTGARLYPQDLEATEALGSLGFYTADQLRRFYYPQYAEHSANNRFTRLVKDGFWQRTPMHARSSRHAIGRSTYAYYLLRPNLTALSTYLEATAQASLWQQRFAHLVPLNNHEEAFSHQHLWHETDLSEFAECLTRDAPRYGWRVVLFERTSPFSRELRAASGLKYGQLTIAVHVRRRQHGQLYTETRQEVVSFNPDAIYILQSPEQRYEFLFHEEDNNTSQPRTFVRKLLGYQALADQGYFTRIAAHYIKKYQLPITGDLSKIGFRVSIGTPDVGRRDSLFEASLPLKGYKRFLFTTMPEVTPSSGFGGRIWIRGKEYAPIKAQLDALPPETAPAIRAALQRDLIAQMPRISLAD
jgi:hypothetical protein